MSKSSNEITMTMKPIIPAAAADAVGPDSVAVLVVGDGGGRRTAACDGNEVMREEIYFVTGNTGLL